MRILSLSFAVAALALAFTPAVSAQENTDHVRKAYLRMQARQAEVRHKERVLAKAQEWAARKQAQNKRDAWISENAPHLAAAPERAGVERPSSPQEFMQIRAIQRSGDGQVQRAKAFRQNGGDASTDSAGKVNRPRTRQQVKAARERIQANQQIRQQGDAPSGKVFRPKAAMTSRQADAQAQPATRQAIRPAAGRPMRSSDQPRSGGAVRSQGGGRR